MQIERRCGLYYDAASCKEENLRALHRTCKLSLKYALTGILYRGINYITKYSIKIITKTKYPMYSTKLFYLVIK